LTGLQRLRMSLIYPLTPIFLVHVLNLLHSLRMVRTNERRLVRYLTWYDSCRIDNAYQLQWNSMMVSCRCGDICTPSGRERGCIQKTQPNGHVLNSDWIAGMSAGGDASDGCWCDMGGSCCDSTNASNGGATTFDRARSAAASEHDAPEQLA
jgi:hypothetical protein